ncbi:S-DNA-T family DNA segregation ATPase FtsK/SpoIIIE [Humitalea rosea]|uniref:DNA translocase FtsK n=2 Tax=Humitalea rosea TaxID=990373 RepID=A0A2W7HX62_9PROT|nr:DNA translocase FtsK 4TM domain-containing protein [Humitalea rosea]PZW37985.1 S-DNA-T family DNA segregation ATPase FtsK/SpoIIIE [Humitalea rosea]
MPRAALVETQQPATSRRFASPAVKAALRRRAAEVLGLVLALGGLALLVALGTYDVADPSLSTATDRPAGNLAGPIGAILADLLWQAFGWAALLLPACLLVWAARLASRRGLAPFAGRLAALLAGLVLVAAALTLAPLPAELPSPAGAGGAAGPVLAHAIMGLAGGNPEFGMVTAGLIIVLALGTAWFALALPRGSMKRTAKVAGRGAAGGMGWLFRRVRRPARDPLAEPVRMPQPARASPPARVPPSLSPRMPASERRPEPDVGQAPAQAAPPLRAGPHPPSEPGLAARALGAAAGMLRRAPAAADPRLSALLRNADTAAARATGPLDIPRGDRPRVAERNPPPRKVPQAAQPPLDLPDGRYRPPPLSLLTPAPERRDQGPSEEALQNNARMLESVLEDYGVRGRIVEIRPGPVVTLYELEPAPGTKSARVIGLADDIARSMSVLAVRIATVPMRNVIGIEMPNAKREMVYLHELLSAADWARNPGRLPLALGKDIGGAPVVADLAKMPHLLIAGTTGSGKSVGINTMILSLLYRFTPDECRMIMIDPKMLELSVYDRIPHLLAPVVTEPPKAIGALKWTVREMERRYRSMSQLGVRNIAGYNEKIIEAQRTGQVPTRRVQTGFDPETGKPVFEEQPLALTPYPMIVVVIDEMADLMIVAGKEIEAAVQRLAQMARASGIHVIMATQRPSVDVITGTIKANFPTRISFSVTSKIDSRTILGEQGAEQLLGMGDMLHMAGGGRLSRVHGPFVSDEEVERVVEWLREQGEPSYVEEVTEAEEDDGSNPGLSGIAAGSDAEKSLFDQAVELVTREGKASTSFIQRHLNIGYNRAAKLIEQMEKEGVVGGANHVGKREVLAQRRDDD